MTYEFEAVIARKPLPLKLQAPLIVGHDDPSLYQPPKGLAEAIDVALLLGVPIVLTGEPGTGKTQAAVWLADYLTDDELLRMDVKSTTLGSDLLYTFDDVARFRDATAKRLRPLIHYLRFNSLGEAILRAAGGGRDAVLSTVANERLEGDVLAREGDLLLDAFGADWSPSEGAATTADLLPRDAKFRGAARQSRVVLIDELDKAPRDTPNDLLSEVESMSFLIPELGLRVKSDKTVRPVVVITSNNEKPLPEPFLRRCAYFNLPRVPEASLSGILAKTILRSDAPTPLSNETAAAVESLHDEGAQLSRRPGTAEALAWMTVLTRKWKLQGSDSLKVWVRKGTDLTASLGALVKHEEDRAVAERLIRQWADGPARRA